jgi:glycosyltransferase involved in cell wall biosynthesis
MAGRIDAGFFQGCIRIKLKNIVILNGNHLCHNPRVIKEATALADAGFHVEVLGAWLAPALAARDAELVKNLPFAFTPIVRLEGAGVSARIGSVAARGRRWLAFRLKRAWDFDSPHLLGYGVRTLLGEALSRRADLYIAHSEPGLWVANELRTRGFRVGVDMEDWFSEDLLPDARRTRPLSLLRCVESALLKEAVHRTCTSQAMGEALSRAYECAPPLTIYNAFPWAQRTTIDHAHKDRPLSKPGRISIHWFSQSIGPGRGLECLFDSLALLGGADAEVHLRGSLWSGYRLWLEKNIPADWRERIFLHPLVPNEELLSRIAEHDIGVALEPEEPESRNVTVTNKILQYMQAGLAVVATATRGQREIAAMVPAAVRLCKPDSAEELAACLRLLISDIQGLKDAKSASLEAARNVFSWEAMAPKLVESVERALA